MPAPKPPHLHKPSGRRPWRHFNDEEIAKMAFLWESGKSQTFIAREFSTAQAVVSRVLREAGVPMPLESRYVRRLGEDHNRWKGGVVRTDGGYVAEMVSPSDPYASMRNRAGYVPQHRLVVARHLGRPLLRSETVHHINGERADNRVENLQLRQGRHGKGAHFVCGDCGSRNITAAPLASLTED